MVVYVYSKHVKSGREEFINIYDTWEEAIAKMRYFYNVDKEHCSENEYYYFAKER